MIKIFNANDTDFSSNGEIIINPIKCIETKKKSLNGWYLDVEISIKYAEYIEQDKLCVVQTKSKLNPQAFRIGENIEYTNRKIKFTANHVMFDARDYILVDVRPTDRNGINTLNYINERTDKTSPFNMFSNVQNTNTAYFIRKNLLEAWQTVEERWNGVFDADNWDISFLQKVGHDNGESVIYGKNMQSMKIFEDWSGVCTRIYPVGYDGIILPEKFIDSDIQYEKPYSRVVDFQTNLEQEEQTEENLISELRENAQKYLEQNKYPKVSYTTVSNINNKMEIGDTIQVLHPLVTVMTEVIEYQYDIVSKKIKSLTFGNYTRDVKAKFNNIKETINTLNQQLSKQDIVIKQQTDLINSLNKNGYVYIDDNEILILDTLPKEKAKNVWRFGLGGIGFSSNGYEGPFETAITMDGQINAKFITTGTMSVNRIEGLSDTLNGLKSSIELNEGNITMLVEQQTETSKKLKEEISTAKQDAIDSANANTDTKLEEYTTTVQSLIDQKGDSILASVKGDYATKTELGETKTSLQASIELKLNKKDVVSEINASADQIKLNAGRLIITAGNFQLDDKGNITATNATIKGGNIELYDTGETSSDPSIKIVGNKNYTSNFSSYRMRFSSSNVSKNPVSTFMCSGFDIKNDDAEIFATANMLELMNSKYNTTTISADGIYSPVISQTSLKSKKKNIRKLNINAIDLVKNADICIYNFKGEKKGAKKHLGLVIGKGYNCPNLVISENGEAIEQYSYTSLLYKAFQQLILRVEKLEEVN